MQVVGGVGMGPLVFPPRARRRVVTRMALLASDVLMLGAATIVASLLRFGTVAQDTSMHGLGRVVTFADLSFVIVGVCIAALYFERLYNVDRVFWGTGEYMRAAFGHSVGIVTFLLATYLLGVPALSRGWIALVWGLGIAFVVTGRFTVRAGLAQLRSRGAMLRPMLIVGANAEAEDIIRTLLKNPASGYVPIGCLGGPRPAEGDRRRTVGIDGCAGLPFLGYSDDITRVLDEQFVDTVLIASTAFTHDVLAEIINRLRGRDLDIEMSSGLLDVISSRVRIREASGMPLITIRSVSFSPGQVFVKRVFDIVVGGLVVLVGLPAWLLIALSIRLESKGPVFYKQVRVGRGGKTFRMFKFRSMCDGAEARLDELRNLNEATGPLFKVHNDPRVSRVGKWMRRYSIDEFPQLINVLIGEMSLVGPRPPLPCETAKYSEQDWGRMEVLPGMTGLWQVSGRSALSFEEMVRLDLYYIENWSVGFDMGLMARTIPAVLFARGAY